MLKISAFYLDKQKSFIPKKNLKCTVYHEKLLFQPKDDNSMSKLPSSMAMFRTTDKFRTLLKAVLVYNNTCSSPVLLLTLFTRWSRFSITCLSVCLNAISMMENANITIQFKMSHFLLFQDQIKKKLYSLV